MYRIAFLFLLLSSSFGYAAGSTALMTCPDERCMAIVNAGNAGSRLQMYSYKMDASNTPIDIKNIFSKKIEPGLSSIELNQKSINHYLSLLFSDAPVLNAPVYFYATSGMRMLNFSRQQAYYAKVTQWFTRHPEWKLAVVKTLKSQDEALYGWLAVNYELGRFASSRAPLVSVVDTGSASVQIAFPLTNTEAMNPEDYMDVSIYGRHVSLFTHGFLGLGQDELRNQYLEHGVCFPRDYPLPNGTSATGDFQACTTLMKPLVNGIHQVDHRVQRVLQNNAQQTWYIIGGISAMIQERPLKFDDDSFTNQEFSEKANRQVCQQNWSILGTLYPENKHLFASCLNASYFYSLFVDGFGIKQDQSIHYISKKISTNDWTLGVVLYQKAF